MATSFTKRIHWFLILSGLFLFAALPLGCGGDSADQSYSATIEEGRSAARDMLEQTGAASISLAFVADGRIVWTETFSQADHEPATAPTTETMYCIGSVSKMLVTVAAMQLADRGLVDLEEPVTTYLPNFSMLSPEYAQVTVRMLLNHTSGFPGSDYRNMITANPYPGYAEQVQNSLDQTYLKAPPGFMATYCNDGFTLAGLLVARLAGKSFEQYVQDEILCPLGMNHSQYPLEIFPPGSYAPTGTEGQEDPFTIVNAHGSGGLYSTPSDMGRFALMLLGNGTLDGISILSPEAIQAMAVDQTIGTFDPVGANSTRFGLGWDSVAQPGLEAVGVKAWIKGGNTGYYGTTLLLAPDDGLAAMVTGTKGFRSSNAMLIAERILFRALTERGTIAEFPVPIPAVARPVREATPQELADICGHFAGNATIYRVMAFESGNLSMARFNGTSWQEEPPNLKMRDNGWFSTDQAPLSEFSTVKADGRAYLVHQNVQGHGHYRDASVLAQKIEATSLLSETWRTRLSRTWLLANQRPDVLPEPEDLRFSIHEPSGLEGLLASDTYDATFNILDPSRSDSLAGMLLLLPQAGRDLNDLFVEPRDDGEWMRFGSWLYRPLETMPELFGNTGTIEIGAEGLAEWRTVAEADSERILKMTTSSPWSVFGPEFELVATNEKSGQVSLPAESGNNCLIVYGRAGDVIAWTIEK